MFLWFYERSKFPNYYSNFFFDTFIFIMWCVCREKPVKSAGIFFREKYSFGKCCGHCKFNARNLVWIIFTKVSSSL